MAMSPRLLRPRATGFNPKSISGLQLWLDASDASSVVLNGSTVSQWSDKSGNGRNATQGTANNQPTFSAAARNGRSVLSFDGSNDSLLTSSFSISQPFTIALVGKINSTAANGNFSDGGTSGRAAVFFTTGNGGQWATFAGVAISGGVANTDWHVFHAHFNGSSSSLYVDGASVASGNAGTDGFNGLRIGGYTASIALLNGSIAEMYCYSGQSTADSRSKITQGLAKKWGITVA
jgi:hypothetical protein